MAVQKAAPKAVPKEPKHPYQGLKYTVLASVAAFRIANALSTKTFFQPDEYWQSLEPAHRLAYGYGYLTWEWHEGLRSSLPPLLGAGIYKALQLLSLEDPQIVRLVPKLLMAVFASAGDVYTWKLSAKLQRPAAAPWALFVSLFSAFNWFFVTRTFSNSAEMVFTTIALTYWHFGSDAIDFGRLSVALFIGALSCVLRPTNAILWAVLGAHLVLTSPCKMKILWLSVRNVAMVFAAAYYVDYLYYGEPVFPLLNFLKFNLLQSLAHFYGTSPFFYYFYEGLPLLTVGWLPLTLWGLWINRSNILVKAAFAVIAAFSLIRHKEVRFIYPLLPILHLAVADAITHTPKRIRKRVFWTLALVNIVVAGYFSQVHQRGVIDVVEYLSTEPNVTSVGFLMPCHSTPYQSHLHRDIPTWFLTCEPPIGFTVEEQKTYLDQADRFYKDPLEFLQTQFPDSVEVSATEARTALFYPSHVAIFVSLEDHSPEAIAHLISLGYKRGVSFFNSHAHDDWRRTGRVVVYNL